MAIVVAGLIVWSLLAWIGYSLADPVLNWVATSGGLLLDGGKELAGGTAVGKEVSNVVGNFNVGGFWAQTIALLQMVLKPAILVIWAIGAFALIAAPFILSRIGGVLTRYRH